MKSICLVMGTGLVSVLVGCASTPVAVAPVGPNPLGIEGTSAKGELQVFSSLEGCSEGDNPTWWQHSDYNIYNVSGKLIKRVDNTVGHYEEAPRQVALPAGTYLIEAHASDYFRVDVPVTIERGRTTRVHLDGQWRVPGYAPKTEVVCLPSGSPVGWLAEVSKPSGVN